MSLGFEIFQIFPAASKSSSHQAVMKALPRRAADLSSSGLGSVCTAVVRWQSPPEAVQPLLSALAKSVGMLEPREVDAQLCFRGWDICWA